MQTPSLLAQNYARLNEALSELSTHTALTCAKTLEAFATKLRALLSAPSADSKDSKEPAGPSPTLRWAAFKTALEQVLRKGFVGVVGRGLLYGSFSVFSELRDTPAFGLRLLPALRQLILVCLSLWLFVELFDSDSVLCLVFCR